MEYEIKLKIKDLDEARILLDEKAVFLREILQEDIYFKSPIRDFGLTDEALRLRIENGKSMLTYKGPRIRTEAVKAREEIEVLVNDADAMTHILEKLGFKPFAVLRKRRRIYKYHNAYISLDNVEKIGYFIEIELIEGKPEKIFDLIADLGLSRYKTEDKTYLEMFLELNRKTGEVPRDC